MRGVVTHHDIVSGRSVGMGVLRCARPGTVVDVIHGHTVVTVNSVADGCHAMSRLTGSVVVVTVNIHVRYPNDGSI